MKPFRRLFTMALALLMLCSIASAEVVLSEPGTIPLSNETIHLKIGIPTSSVVEDWKTNAQTLKLEKDLNVELEFEEMPSDRNEFNQKIELMMIAGGDELPDVIMATGSTFNMADLVKWGEMGMIVPTTEYYKSGKAVFTEATLASDNRDLESILPYVTCYDGEVYGVFGYNESPHNPYSGCFMFVYEPFLEALDMEKPVTTDDFVEMLRAFRDKDPNGNGTADEIPLMAYNSTVKSNLMRYLMNPFIYTQENFVRYNEETGKIEFVANQEAWKEGTKWVKSLVDEGLISPLSFTQNKNAMTAIMNGEPEVVGCVANISTSNLGGTDIRRSKYSLLDPLVGPEGLCQTAKVPTAIWLPMVITKNCENPEAAFRFGDYMCEEMMSVWNRYGEKDVDWTVPEAGTKGVYESLGYPAAISVISPWGVLQNKWWALTGPFVITTKWSCQAAVNTDYNAAYAIARSMKKYTEVANPHPITSLVYNEAEQEIVKECQTVINDYVINSWSEFVTGVKDIENDWDTYVSFFEKMNLTDYLAAMQSSYDRMFAK